MSEAAVHAVDDCHARVREWADNVAGDRVATHALPSGKPERSVSIYLLDILHVPPVKSVREPRLHATLRYLVTAWTDPITDGHRWLAQLLQAAVQTDGFELEGGSLPLEVWSALGVPPRPGFILRVPVQLELTPRRVPLVRREMTLEMAPLRPLYGQLTGPGDLPLAGALIEVPSLRLATRTDFNGRFSFGAVPTDPDVPVLRIVAKGREFTIDGGRRQAPDGTVQIHLKSMED